MTKSKLLRHCLQGMLRWEDRFDRVSQADAPWIIERLRYHKLLPFAASLGGAATRNCEALTTAFRDMQMENLAREQYYYTQAKEIYSAFESRGIRFTPYKGPWWGERIFPQYSWRYIGDMDVVMSLDDARAAAALLAEQGYVLEVLGPNVEDDFAKRGELTCHPGPNMPQRTHVQLHWELMPAPRFVRRYYIKREDFAEGATPATWRKLSYMLPRPEVRLLYHVLHATCQHQFNRFVLIADMALFIGKHPQLNWQALYELARERGCLTPLHYGLRFVDAFFDLPAEAHDVVRRTRPGIRTRLFAAWLRPSATLRFTQRRGRNRRKLFRLAMSQPA